MSVPDWRYKPRPKRKDWCTLHKGKTPLGRRGIFRIRKALKDAQIHNTPIDPKIEEWMIKALLRTCELQTRPLMKAYAARVLQLYFDGDMTKRVMAPRRKPHERAMEMEAWFRNKRESGELLRGYHGRRRYKG